MAGPCCLEQAVLDSLPLPTAIYDNDRLLYANPAFAQIFGEAFAHPGAPLDDIIVPDSRERTRELLARPFSADALPTRCSIAVRTEKGTRDIVGEEHQIQFGPAGQRAVVCFASQIDGTPVFEFNERDKTGGNGAASVFEEHAECIHVAAFEYYPAPLAVLDKERLRHVNRRLRQILRASQSMHDTVVGSLLHPSFADQGAERRHLVIDLGASLTESSVKLRAFDGTDLYTLLDVWPASYRGTAYMVTLVRSVTRM